MKFVLLAPVALLVFAVMIVVSGIHKASGWLLDKIEKFWKM